MAWTTPATASAGELTSAFWNEQVRDNFKALGDAWTSYTPTLGGWTGGNGTLSGAYMQAGKLVHFRAKLVVGSTTTVSGNPTLTLPVTATAARCFAGSGAAYDVSGTAHAGLDCMNNSTTTVTFRDGSNSLSSTVPFTWATGDELYVSGTYEAA